MTPFKFWIKQFCLNTGLHGFKFIVLPKRILLERVIWVCIVSSSIITAVVLLFVSKKNFEQNPTTLVTDSIHHPIWNYPFPAVTICSFNKISRKRLLKEANKISNKLNYTDHEIANLLALLSQLYFHNEIKFREGKKFLQLIQLLDHNDLDLNDLLRSIAPWCDDILRKCKWKEEERRCDTIFEKIITSEGHCCSFNYFAPKNYSFRGLYPGKAPRKPRHVSACGFQTSLEVIVDTSPDDFLASDTLAYGNKIIIHSSYNYPDWSFQSYLVGLKIMALIGINPTITHAMPPVKSVSVAKRLCYFQDELPLRNFRIYTYHNCLTECRMNLTIEYCGCVPLIFVNEYDYENQVHRVCSIRDLTCLDKYTHLIRSSMPGVEIERENNKSASIEWDERDYSCGCLPDCEFVDYVFEASQGTLTRKYSSNQRNLYGGVNLTNHSVIRVYFNDLVGTRNRRNVVNNWKTYLAFYGGILGFFVGFSFISGIESIFFFTAKLFSDICGKVNVGKNKIEEVQHNITIGANDMLSRNIGRHREINRNDIMKNRFLN